MLTPDGVDAPPGVAAVPHTGTAACVVYPCCTQNDRLTVARGQMTRRPIGWTASDVREGLRDNNR
jgi:hypothetical protein